MQKFKYYFLFVIIFSVHKFSYAQMAIEWQNCIGGPDMDFGKSLCLSKDSMSYYVAGYTNSDTGNFSGNHGGMDIFVSKLDLSGNIKWTKLYGGIGNDFNYCIIPANDDGVLIGGYTNSNDSLISGNHGGYDVLLIKIDSSGNMQWENVYGGTLNEGDHGISVVQTDDSGFVFVTGTKSNDGDVNSNHGSGDFWIVKTDSTGNFQWQRCYGGTGDEDAHIILPMNDGGFIFAGHTTSNDGDVSGLHSVGFGDAWVVRIDSAKNIKWQKCLGGTGVDLIKSMCFAENESIILAGYTNSNDSDITGNHGDYDCWLIKLDSAGNKIWSKVYGGTTVDYATGVFRNIDDEYVVGGYSNSLNGDVTGNHGSYDFWIFKVDSTGTLFWQKSYGGAGNDRGEAVTETPDSGIIVTGWSNSTNGDISGNHGLTDCWAVKLITCQKPVAAFTSSSDTICANDTVFFTNISVGAGALTYQWYLNDSLIDDTTDVSLVLSVSGTDTISLVSNFGDCSDTATQTVIVKPLPFVNLGNDTACQSCNILLDAGNPGSSYIWSTGDTTQTILISQPDTFSVTVTSNGCAFSDTIVVGLFTDVIDYNNTSGVSIYPVPVNDKLLLSVEYSGMYNFAFLFDIQGRMIQHIELKNSMEIMNTAELNKGVYILRLSGRAGNTAFKIIKM